jgi:hypothetical protein
LLTDLCGRTKSNFFKKEKEFKIVNSITDTGPSLSVAKLDLKNAITWSQGLTKIENKLKDGQIANEECDRKAKELTNKTVYSNRLQNMGNLISLTINP